MEPTIAEFTSDDFYIRQYFTGCLAQMAYYVESNGEAVIIDPMRDHDAYLQLAETRKAKLTHIFQTHFHADFVSGHFDIAKTTGAKIVFGPSATSKLEIYTAKDNEDFKIGQITLRVLHTPGHTPESSTFLLLKSDGTPYSIFTGDTLFLGDVGRPDLAVSGSITKSDLASWLFDSLRNKIMTLPDDVIVFPGHGAGSACGQNIGSGTYCTLGKQKANNYALQKMEKDEFVKILTEGIPPPPLYFFHDAGLNRNGYQPLSEVMSHGKTPLTLEKFLQLQKEGMVVIDTRVPYDFLTGYIKGSYNINLVMNFASWVGTLIDAKSKIILVCEVGKEIESITRLARIGYDDVLGFLDGGIETFKKSGLELSHNKIIEGEEFLKSVFPSKPFIIDVRNIKEFEVEHIQGALSLPLNTLEAQISKDDKILPHDKDIYIKCKAGGRASTATSILSKYGITNIINIKDGLDALKKIGIETVQTDH